MGSIYAKGRKLYVQFIDGAGPAEELAYLSAADAARVAGVRVETIRRWVQSRQLRGQWAGRLLRIERSDLQAFLSRPASEPDVGSVVARILGHRAA